MPARPNRLPGYPAGRPGGGGWGNPLGLKAEDVGMLGIPAGLKEEEAA